MITVIAHYRAHPGQAEQVRAVLARHSRASAAEAGYLQFLACQDAEDPERFALYEAYEDEAAFVAHRRTVAPPYRALPGQHRGEPRADAGRACLARVWRANRSAVIAKRSARSAPAGRRRPE